MIEKIEIESPKIKQIEKSFPQFLRKNSINKNLLDDPFTEYYVYTENDQILGFINYDILYERAELLYIAVLEEAQNRKIGSKLLEFMIENCKKKNIQNITLEVNVENKRAIFLYEKYGFTKVAVRKNYYQGIDGILMEKELIE